MSTEQWYCQKCNAFNPHYVSACLGCGSKPQASPVSKTVTDAEAALRVALRHADQTTGQGMDSLAFRVLAEEVRQLRARIEAFEAADTSHLPYEKGWQDGRDDAWKAYNASSPAETSVLSVEAVRKARLEWAMVCGCPCKACDALYIELQRLCGDLPEEAPATHDTFKDLPCENCGRPLDEHLGVQCPVKTEVGRNHDPSGADRSGLRPDLRAQDQQELTLLPGEDIAEALERRGDPLSIRAARHIRIKWNTEDGLRQQLRRETERLNSSPESPGKDVGGSKDK